MARDIGKMRNSFDYYPNKRLLALHSRLNAIFVKRRDGSGDVVGIWRQLQIVERALNSRRVLW